MKTIKFKHRYTKAPYLYKAILLQIFKIHYKDLSKVFISYDTEIFGTLEFYKLPKTDLLVLFFISKGEDAFTTIRRWTPEKFDYYSKLVGQEVKIEIE